MNGAKKPMAMAGLGALLTGLADQLWAACPDLRAQLSLVAVAAVTAAVATWTSRPVSRTGLWATLVGCATAGVGAGVVKVLAICPDLAQQWPALVVAGAVTAWGLTIRGAREDGGSR